MNDFTSRLTGLILQPRHIPEAVARRSRQLLARSSLLQWLRWRLTSRSALFSRAYESRAWNSDESGSGTGSELRATVGVREQLPGLLTRLGAGSLLDAPCGDWNWMQHVALPPGLRYFGADIVQHVIEDNRRRFADGQHDCAPEFIVADLTRDPLPRADVILCRDCLVHVSFEDASMILENFRSTGATWLLLNTHPEVRENRNQLTGAPWRRLHYCLPPFGFPEPVETIPDGGGSVAPKTLALWRLQELPRVQ